MKLDRKVALITGVGSGIGRAAARLFVEAGATVFGVDRNLEAGQSLATELSTQNFHFWSADLSTQAAAIAAVEQCYQTCGRVDVLYNNAGISIVEPFTEMKATTVEQILAINFLSVFYLCQQVIPIMQQQQSGVIINTASELAFVAQPLFTAYCASKGAVLSFTRSLALEYAHTNIRINALCPGPIDTPMLKAEFATDTNPQKARHDSITSIPIGRIGEPAEIAQVALFLACDAPRLMHGSSLLVDGGKTIL